MIDRSYKRRVAEAFGQADHYDSAAEVQRQVAAELAERITRHASGAAPAILEIGCGTGFLTRALSDSIGPARWTVTDLAPEMVERARVATGVAGDYRVLDGEHPAVDGDARFDIICSSLAFQWFGNLAAALGRLQPLLKPGGVIAFSTMAAQSFSEWADAHRAEHLTPGTPLYPDAAALTAMVPQGLAGLIDIVDYPQQHADARAFLLGLKAIGAGVSAAGHRPLSAPDLRRAMARFDAGARIATYRVAFCLLHDSRFHRPAA